MKKKAFTLIEVLIAIIIAAVLFTLVFRAYVNITQISARLENEKKLNAEITFLTETVQNIADIYQIDYNAYGSTLNASNWRTDTLYLTGNGATGTKLVFSGPNLLRITNNTTTELISTGIANLYEWSFRVIPFTQLPTDGFLDIQHPGFRLVAGLRSARYKQSDRVRDVSASMQQFYNLQRVER